MTAQPAAEAYASHALSLPDCLAHGKRYRGVTLEQGIDYFVSRQDCGKTAFGWAMEDTDHIVKIIAEARSKIILGAHLIGPQASSMIRPLIQAMSFEQPAPQVPAVNIGSILR